MQRSTSRRHSLGRSTGGRVARRGAAAVAALALAAAALLGPGVATAASAATTATTPDQWTGVYGSAGSTSSNPGEHVLTTSTSSKIRLAYAESGRNDGAYPPVVLGGVAYSVGGGTSPRLYATSPKTGAVLWSMAFPYALSSYGFGMTGTGSTILVAFRTDPAGGVLAVNAAKHTILWRAFFPPTTTAGDDRSYPGIPTTDGTRVFIQGSSNSVNAYSLSTGAFLWSHPYTDNDNGGRNSVDGSAAGGGYFYTGGGEGLVAYSASTGKKVWTSYPAISYGVPVLAGGRVFVNAGDDIEAFSATGCGTTSCKPLWSVDVDSWDFDYIGIAGADSTSLFISYRTIRAGGPTQCQSGFIGHIARLSASTGKTQWQTSIGDYAQGIVRGGNVIWVVNEYVNAQCVGDQYRLLGYSATATGTAPLATVAIPSAYGGYPQALSVGSGTVFETPNDYTLVGYRVPGT
ncbi:PQQ-binding-like beta-propeller repeat protein [Frondihabitans australicus]|uniref:Putative pyrroloquinoline-quinone binding quinoprotein n=1 Tax=Frondihabitans australicus TaxID=386892 RepID=A0A495IBM6_9MICO|nr:PQQ-binding-like beta-propeller repeat protein [Frondihabitans australicus]RKR73332.1 putative pyrroloquinoline-quinone binding quinoprotein [Frondihabitans australicus]